MIPKESIGFALEAFSVGFAAAFFIAVILVCITLLERHQDSSRRFRDLLKELRLARESINALPEAQKTSRSWAKEAEK